MVILHNSEPQLIFPSDDFETGVEYTADLLRSKPFIKLALVGDMGVGKTFFVKSCLKKLDPCLLPQVSSPTFSFCNIYENLIKVVHFDLYMVNDLSTLHNIGLWDFLETSEGPLFIEWADKFVGVADACDLVVDINQDDGLRRCLSITANQNIT